MVGAVIVAQGRIIGEGYHARCGEAHAEVNAVRAVSAADRPLLREATLYVSLEPCAHVGRTPPCAEMIVREGIPRVVVGCVDPFARVSGRGIAILREGGVEVVCGVLEEACRALNRRFIAAQTLRRPYITLKWARSADGFLDHWRTVDEALPPAQLSTARSLIRMHHLRAQHDAILVGHTTLQLDHPQLSVRYWSGRQPQRIVLGRIVEGELPQGYTAYDSIATMLPALFAAGTQSLLVEGGTTTLQSFIDSGLWDEAREELSSVLLSSGVPAPRMPFGVPLRTECAWGTTYNVWRNAE